MTEPVGGPVRSDGRLATGWRLSGKHVTTAKVTPGEKGERRKFISPFLFALRRNSQRKTLADVETSRNRGIISTGSKENGPIVCNGRQRTDSATRPDFP